MVAFLRGCCTAAPSRENSVKMQHRLENAPRDKCGIITHSRSGQARLPWNLCKVCAKLEAPLGRTQIANFDSFSGFLAKSIIRRVRPTRWSNWDFQGAFLFPRTFYRYIYKERESGQKGGEKCFRTICEAFSWKFLCRNANKIRCNEKIPFDGGSQQKEECSKNISHFRRAPKDKEGKEGERQAADERRCPQWGVLSATSTGYDKVAHSLPTVTTSSHCLCPSYPPALSTGYLFQHIWKPNFLPATPCANYDDVAKIPSIAAQRTCLRVLPNSSNGANIKQKAPTSSTL